MIVIIVIITVVIVVVPLVLLAVIPSYQRRQTILTRPLNHQTSSASLQGVGAHGGSHLQFASRDPEPCRENSQKEERKNGKRRERLEREKGAEFYDHVLTFLCYELARKNSSSDTK